MHKNSETSPTPASSLSRSARRIGAKVVTCAAPVLIAAGCTSSRPHTVESSPAPTQQNSPLTVCVNSVESVAHSQEQTSAGKPKYHFSFLVREPSALPGATYLVVSQRNTDGTSNITVSPVTLENPGSLLFPLSSDGPSPEIRAEFLNSGIGGPSKSEIITQFQVPDSLGRLALAACPALPLK